MSPLRARGFTLVEMMVALVLLATVAGGIYRVLVGNQRAFLTQTQQIELQQNIRAGATILPTEFRALDAADGDIAAMSASSITIRAIRKLGFICVAPALGGGTMSFTVRAQPFYGNSGPTFAAGDSVLVFYEGSVGTRSDDSWVPGQVSGVAGGTCPDPGTSHPGYVVSVQPQWLAGQANAAGNVTGGSPVYGFAIVTYGLYESPADDRWYVGQAVQGSPMLPLIGPLTGPSGLTFTYYDSTGAPTGAAAQVAQIGIVLRAATTSQVRMIDDGDAAYRIDSVSTRVALRNNPRCGPCL